MMVGVRGAEPRARWAAGAGAGPRRLGTNVSLVSPSLHPFPGALGPADPQEGLDDGPDFLLGGGPRQVLPPSGSRDPLPRLGPKGVATRGGVPRPGGTAPAGLLSVSSPHRAPPLLQPFLPWGCRAVLISRGPAAASAPRSGSDPPVDLLPRPLRVQLGRWRGKPELDSPRPRPTLGAMKPLSDLPARTSEFPLGDLEPVSAHPSLSKTL